jgi:hypothetical protein
MNDNGRIMKELKELTEAMKNVSSSPLTNISEIPDERRSAHRW